MTQFYHAMVTLTSRQAKLAKAPLIKVLSELIGEKLIDDEALELGRPNPRKPDYWSVAGNIEVPA